MKTVVRLVVAGLLTGALIAAGPAQAVPGPGSKLCTPGQNNVGGGPGNSGPGDKQGAPLKPSPHCPGK